MISHVGKWVEFDIMLSKISQRQRQFSLIGGNQKIKKLKIVEGLAIREVLGCDLLVCYLPSTCEAVGQILALKKKIKTPKSTNMLHL